jgi:uncharacterized protein YdhG (YjbR/CyaY superfamily)
MDTSYKTTDEYIERLTGVTREKIEELRKIIKSVVPEATEKISYSMPAFDQNGIIVYYAAFKDHVSLFPTSSGIEHFAKELEQYKTSKGTIQFPVDQPLPRELIERIVKFRLEENLSKPAKNGKPVLEK